MSSTEPLISESEPPNEVYANIIAPRTANMIKHTVSNRLERLILVAQFNIAARQMLLFLYAAGAETFLILAETFL